MAPEYPESLSTFHSPSSTTPTPDRADINDAILNRVLPNDLNVRATSYGAVGHSLGCGTVSRVGNDSWTKVYIAGGGGSVDAGAQLVVASANDGVVRGLDRILSNMPAGFVELEEDVVPAKFPRKAALLFRRPPAPNHISFLAEGVNDSMIDFLSPLLPVATLLGVPVLDFDRYKESRDAELTAGRVVPVVTEFLCQNMSVK